MRGSTDREGSVWATGKSHISLEAMPCVKESSLCVCWCWLWASPGRTDAGNSEVTGPVTSTPAIVVPISVNRADRRRASNQPDGGSSVKVTRAISIRMTAVPTSAPLRVQQVTRVAGNSEVTGPVTSMPTTAARISVNRRTRPRGSDDDRAGRWREHPARTVKGRTGVLPFRLYTASSVPDSVSAIGVLLTGRAS
jgi:hypothetical protein